jgi:hypothetical protein
LYYLGGSPLSGSNSWSGFCVCGCGKKSGQYSELEQFSRRRDVSIALRRQFPQEVSYWEEYDGSVFFWGGSGLQPARKRRLIVKPVVEAVAFNLLIEELKSGKARKGAPPKPLSVTTKNAIELRTRNGGLLTFC